MNCTHHSSQVATSICSKCGEPLCSKCANLFEPPVCLNCASLYANEVKAKMIRNIGLSVILGVVGVIIGGPPCIVLLGLPYGWSLLDKKFKFNPNSLSNMGFAMILFFRFVLALLIGIIATPIQITQWIKEMKRVSMMQENISQQRKHSN